MQQFVSGSRGSRPLTSAFPTGGKAGVSLLVAPAVKALTACVR